jgi:hypothetical protein
MFRQHDKFKHIFHKPTCYMQTKSVLRLLELVTILQWLSSHSKHVWISAASKTWFSVDEEI